MNNSPLISIIVPVYNTEKYLPQCLNSIINQTYRNLEIIVVNDGSTDNSSKILNEFKNKDNRIIVINQQNNGVSKARNIALQISTGEYVMFVDSDDWLDLDICGHCIRTILQNNTDIVFFSYLREFENGVKKRRLLFPDEKTFDKNDAKNLRRRLFGLSNEELADPSHADTFGTVFSKLYSSKIITENKIDFVDLNQIGSAEDILFNIAYFKYVSTAYYLNTCSYHLRKYNSTSVTTKYRPRLFEQWQNLFLILASIIDKEDLNNEFKIALNNRIALSIFGLGLNVLAADFNTFRKISELKKIISAQQYINAYSQLTFQFFPVHWKMFFYFAKHQIATGVFMLLKGIQIIIKR